MRFYQRIRFRLIAGKVLLVLAVAALLTWRMQELSKEVLHKQEVEHLSDETNLRFREISGEILTLRGDMAGLVGGPAMRELQWAQYYKEGWITSHPPGLENPEKFLQDAKEKAAKMVDEILDHRPNYLRVEYYLDCTKPIRPLFVRSRRRNGFADATGRPLGAQNVMVQREKRNKTDVSFSHVEVWDGAGSQRIVVLQACLPVIFPSSQPPGLVVVTVDFKPWAQALSRSPLLLVFLAGGDRQLLMYPQPDRPADYVLKPNEADSTQRRFTTSWLTNEQILRENQSAKTPFPQPFGVAPTDDNWQPADLGFLLLRCRIADSLRADPAKREELTRALEEVLQNHPTLVADTAINRAKDEILIRGWPDDREPLRAIRAALTRRFGPDLYFPDREPLLCAHFIRTRYVFALGPQGDQRFPEQRLYVAMATPVEAIDAKINDHWFAILQVVIYCVVAAVALAVLGSFLLTRPLNAITAATQELAAGNANVHLPVRDATEVGVLARSFASMARHIQERRRDLEERTRELETANAALAEARNKAEQVSVAKDYFLATVSHELRTPLNHVMGFIQLLELTDLDEDQQRDLHKISHAADNLLGLVNDLLDYQKLVQGVLTLEPTRINLLAWVEDLADAMRPKFAEKGNQLVVDCPADVGALDADEKRAQQALTNLLSNAAKFTRNGVVTLSVKRERDADREWVRMDVHDTGRGMTPEQQAKLFQPFAKLLTRSENLEGTGLGLVLSQRLCRLMGGDLLLSRSEVGQGSTFTIRLPATSGAAPSPLPARPAVVNGVPGPAKRPTTVLVIDDDPEVRELMRRHLEGHGFTVHLAASGAEGLEMVKRLAPDAITLDVLMPGIDGWGTLAALQADVETAHIPVILITMLDDRTRGFALGAWEILPKPISWSRLIDLLHHIEPSTGPVLLASGDAALRELTARTLKQTGWEVCSVADGRAALAAAARRRPALVLLDPIMPVMDGFEFLLVFRQEPAWREVPVVVLTAKELTDADRRRLNGSVQRILSRGMGSLDELLREVEWLLHSPKNTVALEPVPPGVAEPPAQPAQGVSRGEG